MSSRNENSKNAGLLGPQVNLEDAKNTNKPTIKFSDLQRGVPKSNAEKSISTCIEHLIDNNIAVAPPKDRRGNEKENTKVLNSVIEG